MRLLTNKKNNADVACYVFVGVLIRQCFVSPYKFVFSFEKIDKHVRIKQIAQARMEFARFSPLISHWCDVADIDEERVRMAILLFNQQFVL